MLVKLEKFSPDEKRCAQKYVPFIIFELKKQIGSKHHVNDVMNAFICQLEHLWCFLEKELQAIVKFAWDGLIVEDVWRSLLVIKQTI